MLSARQHRSRLCSPVHTSLGFCMLKNTSLEAQHKDDVTCVVQPFVREWRQRQLFGHIVVGQQATAVTSYSQDCDSDMENRWVWEHAQICLTHCIRINIRWWGGRGPLSLGPSETGGRDFKLRWSQADFFVPVAGHEGGHHFRHNGRHK